eukprot:5689140-Amphidinium_carterae.2
MMYHPTLGPRCACVFGWVVRDGESHCLQADCLTGAQAHLKPKKKHRRLEVGSHHMSSSKQEHRQFYPQTQNGVTRETLLRGPAWNAESSMSQARADELRTSDVMTLLFSCNSAHCILVRQLATPSKCLTQPMKPTTPSLSSVGVDEEAVENPSST